MQIHQYRIDYKWRDADRGQAYRVWRKSFQIIKAVSSEDAERHFARNWESDAEFEIVQVEKVGI